MKTAVVYRSHHGTTEKVAGMIQLALGIENCALLNLKTNTKIDLGAYDRVIIGGSIHAGNIQSKVKEFCNKNLDVLLGKPLGLFLSCMDEKLAQDQFNRAYPEVLRSHAKSCKITGGEFNFDRMNFFEKLIVRKVSGVEGSVSKIDMDKVRELLREMAA